MVRSLADLAGEQSRVAMEQEARQQLVGRAVDLALSHDGFFGQVRRRAEILADYVHWLYRHPEFYPPFLPGGTPLQRVAGGHLVNAADTPVGVFVPQRAVMNPARWQEVGLLSQVDPFLVAMADRTPYAARIWIVTATGIARLYPNPGLGHPGSPVGPQDDPRDWEPFRAAAPESNPGRYTVWTLPASRRRPGLHVGRCPHLGCRRQSARRRRGGHAYGGCHRPDTAGSSGPRGCGLLGPI